ncbi:MAG: WD40 repeat domain-containing protein, partial [Candidatus Zixiibacteriota bacterium]
MLTYFISIICVILILNLSCCDDCPTCSNKPTPGAYNVYMAGYVYDQPNHIWIANSATDSVIDSIPMPNGSITLLDISPNKNYLAALLPDSSTVYIIDTRSKEIIERVGSGFPHFSYDGSYLLIHSNYILKKYSTMSWELLDSFDLGGNISGGALFNNSHKFFSQFESDQYIIFDYETGVTVKKDTMSILASGSVMWITDMIMSPDDQYIYWLGAPDMIFKYDYMADSAVDSFPFIYGAFKGNLANSADGNYLLFTESTDPWNLDDFPVGNLVILEQGNLQSFRRIPTWNLHPSFPGGNVY